MVRFASLLRSPPGRRLVLSASGLHRGGAAVIACYLIFLVRAGEYEVSDVAVLKAEREGKGGG